MKVDFLTRFKGRTSTMNKSEGITGIIKASGTPIQKMNPEMKCCLSQTNSYADQDQLSEYSYQSYQNQKIITNINYPYTRKFSLGTPLKPIQNINHVQYNSAVNPPEQKKAETYNLPLSKTSNFNVNDFEYVVIPKEMLYRIKFGNTEGDYSQPKPEVNRMIKSQILNSYAQQNQRKRSLLQAGLNAIQC